MTSTSFAAVSGDDIISTCIVFEEGQIEGVSVRPLKRFCDARGWLVELFRHDELRDSDHPAMGYLSQTLPGVARGPHEHREQTDLFVFVGPGDFKVYLWDTRPGSPTNGRRQTLILGQCRLAVVVVPPGVVHAYKNISEMEGLVLNCPNRLYAGPGRRDPVDEIRYENAPDSPFHLD